MMDRCHNTLQIRRRKSWFPPSWHLQESIPFECLLLVIVPFYRILFFFKQRGLLLFRFKLNLE